MLERCSEELVYLKSVWDVVSTILYTFNDWCKTPWDKIDVEVLIEETKVKLLLLNQTYMMFFRSWAKR